MRRRNGLWLALLGLALLVAFFVYRSRSAKGDAAAAAKAADPQARVVPVLAIPAARRDVPITLEGLGTATAFQTVTVKTQVDGRLDALLFREGQAVKKGDVLAQIDPRPYLIQLHQAEGALARDEAQLRNANLNLKRFRDLGAQKLVAQQQVDDAMAAAAQLEATARVDRAAIESAKLNLEYARIRAPVDGVTGIRNVDVGNLVRQSDANGIVVLTQLDPIAVIFTLPQDELQAVARARARGPLGVEVTSRSGEPLGKGELLVVDNQINQATATMRLKAMVPNPQSLLWPNQFVNVRLRLDTRKGALALPATAIQRGPSGTFVYVVGSDMTAAIRPVEIELTQGDVVVLSKGVAEGERVVVDGQNQLRPGAKVSLREPRGPGAGQAPGPGQAQGSSRTQGPGPAPGQGQPQGGRPGAPGEAQGQPPGRPGGAAGPPAGARAP